MKIINDSVTYVRKRKEGEEGGSGERDACKGGWIGGDENKPSFTRTKVI